MKRPYLSQLFGDFTLIAGTRKGQIMISLIGSIRP